MDVEQQDFGSSTDLEIMDRLLSVDGKFLIDAGCGNMQLSVAMAERGASVLGIDPDVVQGEKNRQMPMIANVGFAQTGADSIPVESGSVDGVLFSYSLHHVPERVYPAVFNEVLRVLKPEGFIYVIEPVAAGELNEVMSLFHDERIVREAAQTALDRLAIPLFENVSVVSYVIPTEYATWDEYADRYGGKSYNSNYTEAQVRDESVKRRFMELGAPLGFKFKVPMKVTYLQDRKDIVS